MPKPKTKQNSTSILSKQKYAEIKKDPRPKGQSIMSMTRYNPNYGTASNGKQRRRDTNEQTD